LRRWTPSKPDPNKIHVAGSWSARWARMGWSRYGTLDRNLDHSYRNEERSKNLPALRRSIFY
jgi:hypothetical protein